MNLTYDELLSNFAVNSSLRHYTEALCWPGSYTNGCFENSTVGRCRLTQGFRS